MTGLKDVIDDTRKSTVRPKIGEPCFILGSIDNPNPSGRVEAFLWSNLEWIIETTYLRILISGLLGSSSFPLQPPIQPDPDDQ